MEEKIQGTFCKEKLARIGTGHTARKTLQKTYWYVEEHNSLFSCWLLTINGDKIGVPETCNEEEFMKSFTPDFTYPKVKELTEEDLLSIRKLFELQIKYKAEESAKKLILTLVEIQEYVPIDISVFLLETGSLFRKGSLYDVALLCYTEAQKLGLDSATLYFNISRVYLDMQDYKQCITYLKESHIRLKGSSNSINQLVEYLQKNSLIPQESQEDIMYIISSK